MTIQTIGMMGPSVDSLSNLRYVWSSYWPSFVAVLYSLIWPHIFQATIENSSCRRFCAWSTGPPTKSTVHLYINFKKPKGWYKYSNLLTLKIAEYTKRWGCNRPSPNSWSRNLSSNPVHHIEVRDGPWPPSSPAHLLVLKMDLASLMYYTCQSCGIVVVGMSARSR